MAYTACNSAKIEILLKSKLQMLQLLVLQISITNIMVLQLYKWGKFPANIYLFNANSRNTTKKCEICSKLTKKTPKRSLTSF